MKIVNALNYLLFLSISSSYKIGNGNYAPQSQSIIEIFDTAFT